MKVAVPREIKNNEYRVALTPAGVHELVAAGHSVFIETGAGLGSAITDDDFTAAGAQIRPDADTTWAAGDLVLKVKEPIHAEHHRMRPGQTLFTYLHLAASAECTDALLEQHVTGIAYETVQGPGGRLPLLAPMSEVAGRLAVQAGAYHLQRPEGGRGTLMGGVPGTPPARVVIIGAGVSGMNAAAIAVGMRADVELLDLNTEKLHSADDLYQGRLRTIVSNRFEVKRACREADLVVGAVLVPGAKAPTVVDDEVLADMKPGAVLVDIAIDQGGCFAHSRPTTHDDPTFAHDGKVFYCVANMPGAVPNTSTYALTNATLPYVMKLANLGWADALRADPMLAAGLNTYGGSVTNEPVAITHDLPLKPIAQVLTEA
ncbi:alanine dehydrogenase [Glycomyces buryatensis]|uniref:Alanine dehydrogenase n=1 Tax=Glycomyces buryatensis TaxID=2570927 RepID=A0A4S8QAT2_9ACTN|nr:alanine dehydrogenase [Glycomyces buryatensis]THV41370.1 alanine dehydrogenase [Glycomyces buryatensis]